jgi:hypothetical protein
MLSRRSSFSEVERKMLYFTQVHPPLADIREVHAEFEREHDWTQALHALKKKKKITTDWEWSAWLLDMAHLWAMHPASAIF